MFKKLNFNMKQVYPALVVSTMSSGKSTLINALVGKELLPSRNTACTAKAVAILDNDIKTQFAVHAVDEKGKYSFIEPASYSVVAKFNQTNEISEMIIEGEIEGIRNSKKSLLLVDTPGIDNSMDPSHAMATMETLDEYSEGLILYMINAQQIGTYADSDFMTLVVNKLKNNPEFKIVFVVNKMDSVDPDKERPNELIQNCKEYIESKGIENPILIPVSASSALLFKKALNGEPLSEFEEEEFGCSYNRFERKGFSLVDYISVPKRGSGKETVTVGDNQYLRADIYAALDNTGLPFLERTIDEMLIRASKVKAPKITAKRSKAKSEEPRAPRAKPDLSTMCKRPEKSDTPKEK